jgi:hypothetical protein
MRRMSVAALLHSWPVARWGPIDFVVAGRLAVYSAFAHPFHAGRPENLHLLNLATGKDVVIATTRNSRLRDLAIGRRGLVYAVNPSRDNRPAKLVFVPMAKLLATVS